MTSFDAAMAVLTVHHWIDCHKGLAEMRRVSRRQVVLTWDPEVFRHLWLITDYFPELLDTESEGGIPSKFCCARCCVTVRCGGRCSGSYDSAEEPVSGRWWPVGLVFFGASACTMWGAYQLVVAIALGRVEGLFDLVATTRAVCGALLTLLVFALLRRALRGDVRRTEPALAAISAWNERIRD